MRTIAKKLTKTIVGIDYSLTSPAICITDDFVYENSYFYFLTSKKKYEGKIDNNVFGYLHDEWTDPIERFKNISTFVFNVMGKHISPQIGYKSIQKIFIEGYSYGSKGQGLFQIAENCGILKYRLQEHNLPYDTVVPSVVKKFATGKGNADKEKMYDQFYVDTGVNLMEVFEQNTLSNPVTDIVDSWYIAKAGYETIRSKE